MRSIIYAEDQIDNQFLEFGESAEPRYWAMFVDQNGIETPIALTGNQIGTAMNRARNEIHDHDIFVTQFEARRRNRVVLQILLSLVLFLVLVGALTRILIQ